MDLDAIEARANNATEGPWELPERDELGWYAPHQPDTFDDYVFTSRARADVPDLVARVRALEDENQRMRAKLSAIDLVKTWTNEDGKSFIFTDDLLIATGDITPDALSRAREIAEEEA